MSKEQDVAFVKTHFDNFGSDVAERFKKVYDKKGMGFQLASLERLCVKLTEETGEVAAEIFKGDDIDNLLYEIIDAANTLFLMYVNVKELKGKK